MPEANIASGIDVDRLRSEQFPELQPGYLNAATFTPLPLCARQAVDGFQRRRANPRELSEEALVAALGSAREAAAELVGASTEEIALAWNTSYGINLAALALPVEEGSTILISDREFPTNVYPWMACPGARLEIVPADPLGRPDEDRLFERLSRGDVSVFAISSVQFSSGFRADLERFGRFCRERGIFFVVDAIQSLGQLPLDVEASCVDVLATGGQKWLCSPFGTGFVYVRRELLARMEPVLVGWTAMRASTDMSSLTAYEWGYRSDARRFEVSTLPFHDFAGFTASLDLLAQIGVENVARHTARLLSPVREWLREHPEIEVLSAPDEQHSSAILAFRTPSVERVHARLTDAGVTCGKREGAIRLAPHLYNDADDLARVLEVLETSRGSGWG